MGERNYGFHPGAHRVDDPPEPGYEWVWEHEDRPSPDRVNWLKVAIYGGSIMLVLGTLGACATTFWH